MSVVNHAHGLDLYVDVTRSGSKGIVDFRHVEHRHDVIIVQGSRTSAMVAGEENDIEVGDVDRRFVGKGKAWVRHNNPNSCIRSSYIEERVIKDFNEGWRRICRIEANERVVCTPLRVVCTHHIVVKGVNVLSMLTISFREP